MADLLFIRKLTFSIPQFVFLPLLMKFENRQMFKKKVKKKPNAIDYILSCCNENAFRQTDDDDLEILVDIIRLIRPSNPNAVDVNLTDLIRFLQSNRDCTAQLAEYIKRVLHRMKFNKFLSDAAILQDVDFFFEI